MRIGILPVGAHIEVAGTGRSGEVIGISARPTGELLGSELEAVQVVYAVQEADRHAIITAAHDETLSRKEERALGRDLAKGPLESRRSP